MPSTRPSSRLFTSLLFCTGLWASAASVAIEPHCQVLPALPGSPPNLQVAHQQAAALCAIDFNSDSVAVCPKTWSTSPAALIYDLRGTQWAGKAADFEAKVCELGSKARGQAAAELAVFKHSMNGGETSATYAPASLLYPALTQWLGMRVNIPVATLQEFPRQWYLQRVAQHGKAATEGKSSVRMLHAAWVATVATLSAPDNSTMTAEMLSANGESLWGVNLLFTGKRYGPEVNGTRASGWGKGQNRDFQQTAPYLLLRQDQALPEATATAIEMARKDPAMAKELPAAISTTQVQWWAGEIIEIVLLDYLLGQQDRIGNIDYQWRWFWVNGTHVESRPSHSSQTPEDLATLEPVRLRATWLNDNDAGVRTGYANFARLTRMLDGLRHFDPALYMRIKQLAEDFRNQGPVYQAIGTNYRIRSKELAGIARRLTEIEAVLTDACRAGALRWDLDATTIIRGSASTPVDVSCDS